MSDKLIKELARLKALCAVTVDTLYTLGVITLTVPVLAMCTVVSGLHLVLLILLLCSISFSVLFTAFIMEVSVGGYTCKECGAAAFPTMGQALMCIHFGKTRHLYCQHCGKRTWHKKDWVVLPNNEKGEG